MKFVSKPNRIYTIMDFEDGEEIEFAYYPSVPSSKARGNEFWRSKVDGRTMLLTPDDLAYCTDHQTDKHDVTDNNVGGKEEGADNRKK